MSSCVQPCLTCFGSSSKFFQCLSCTSSQLTLTSSSLCLKQPIFLIQIICTFLLFLFIILPLMRKRSVTLIHIFDCIQIISYFKYINGYIPNRQNYLYMNMRSWGQWTEGWKLLVIDDDVIIPIWINQQTMINKVLRIFFVWVGVVVIMLLFGVVKTMMGDSQITFIKYIQKNISLAVILGFYINVQDMAFIMANSYYSYMSTNNISGTYKIIQLIISISFLLIITFMLIWIFSIINYDYLKHLQKTPQKIYPYINMFLFSFDYDLFPSYQLTQLPQSQKRIYRYSNIRVIQIIKKVLYSFLILSYLYTDEDNLLGQILSILAFLVFFYMVWYISLPYDLNTEKIQFFISILGDFLTIVILLMPITLTNQIVEMIICLAFFVLAISSAGLEIFMDLYCIIPVDLYQTGLSVIIEDKKLLKQIQQRKKMQQQNQRKLRQMQQNNKKLRQQLQAQKQRKLTITPKQRQQSQQTIPNHQQNKQKYNKFEQQNQQQKAHKYQNNDDQIQQHTSMNSDLVADLYKIDEQKRRKIYQFNKKAKFIYSNKIQD